ncbi:hypothetical protein ACFX19_018933 [Malus domestica]
MDVITFRYLISLVVSEKLNMQLMDLVNAYLNGDLDTKMHMKGYVNNELCPYVCINKSHSGFVIVVVYVDDMNLIGTSAEFEEIAA